MSSLIHFPLKLLKGHLRGCKTKKTKKKIEEKIIVDSYVLLPPEGVFSPDELCKYKWFITDEEFVNTTLCKKKLNKTEENNWLCDYLYLLKYPGDNISPFKLMEAFIFAIENGVYPFLTVLRVISGIFKKYMSDPTKQSLDKLFKLKAEKGQQPMIKKEIIKMRDEVLMREIFRLNLCGYTIDKAVNMVYEKFKEDKEFKLCLKEDDDKKRKDVSYVHSNYNKTGLKTRMLSPEKLKSLYYLKWKKIFNNDSFKKATIEWLKNNKKAYLREHYSIK